MTMMRARSHALSDPGRQGWTLEDMLDVRIAGTD